MSLSSQPEAGGFHIGGIKARQEEQEDDWNIPSWQTINHCHQLCLREKFPRILMIISCCICLFVAFFLAASHFCLQKGQAIPFMSWPLLLCVLKAMTSAAIDICSDMLMAVTAAGVSQDRLAGEAASQITNRQTNICPLALQVCLGVTINPLKSGILRSSMSNTGGNPGWQDSVRVLQLSLIGNCQQSAYNWCEQ